MKLAILILAGGAGSRIGGNKPDRLLSGQRLFDIAVMKAKSWNCPIAAQLASFDQINTGSIQQIIDEPNIGGPLAGLIAGLKWAKSQGLDAILTIPCDCPFLPSNLLERLIQSSHSNNHVIMASSNEKKHPICALWRTEHLEKIESNASSNRLSLWRSANDCGVKTVEWSIEPHDPFFNVNTQEDLERAEAIQARYFDQ